MTLCLIPRSHNIQSTNFWIKSQTHVKKIAKNMWVCGYIQRLSHLSGKFVSQIFPFIRSQEFSTHVRHLPIQTCQVHIFGSFAGTACMFTCSGACWASRDLLLTRPSSKHWDGTSCYQILSLCTQICQSVSALLAFVVRSSSRPCTQQRHQAYCILKRSHRKMC